MFDVICLESNCPLSSFSDNHKNNLLTLMCYMNCVGSVRCFACLVNHNDPLLRTELIITRSLPCQVLF